MGLVNINDPLNLLVTGGQTAPSGDGTADIGDDALRTSDTPRRRGGDTVTRDGARAVTYDDNSAITLVQLIERYLDDAPQVKKLYPTITLNIIPESLKDKCITYGQVINSDSRLSFKFWSQVPDTEHGQPGVVTQMGFTGKVNQLPKLESRSEKLPCGDDYGINSLIARRHIRAVFAPTTIRIILHDFAFNCTVNNLRYVNADGVEYPMSPGYRITKVDDTGDYKEIDIQTVEVPHDYQYNVKFNLIVDMSNWFSGDSEQYAEYACASHTEWGGGVECLSNTNGPVPSGRLRLAEPGTFTPGDVVYVHRDITMTDLNGSATIEYRAYKNNQAALSIVSDGNVSAKDVCDISVVTEDTEASYVIVPPGVQTVFYTHRNNPLFAKFLLTVTNKTKYATVKYRFTNQEGFEQYRALKKSDRLGWLKHYSGNMDGDKPKKQEEMDSWFVVDTVTDQFTLDFTGQYYLIVNAVPVEHPVRAIMYIFKPTDGIEVSVESRPEGFIKDEMRPIPTDEDIYRTTDESHYLIRDTDYDGSGNLLFHIRVNTACQGYNQDFCSGIYITEGASVRNPSYFPFPESWLEHPNWYTVKAYKHDNIIDEGMVFRAPARGFYKNMQIYIRPVSVVEIKLVYLNYYNADYTDTKPTLIYNDEVISPEDTSFTVTSESGWENLTLTIVLGECPSNHFDVTMRYSYLNGSQKVVRATEDPGGIQLDSPTDRGQIIVKDLEHAYKMKYTLTIRCTTKKNVTGRIWMMKSDDAPVFFSSGKNGSLMGNYRAVISDADSNSNVFWSSRSTWNAPESEGNDGYFQYYWEDVNFERAALYATVAGTGSSFPPAVYKSLKWWYGNRSYIEASGQINTIASPEFTMDDTYKSNADQIRSSGLCLGNDRNPVNIKNNSYVNIRPEYYEPARIRLKFAAEGTMLLNGLSFDIQQTMTFASTSVVNKHNPVSPEGSIWQTEDWWESDPWQPWGNVVWDVGTDYRRKIKLHVVVYKRSDGTVEREFDYDIGTVGSDGFYDVPISQTSVMFAADSTQMVDRNGKQLFGRDNNGKYDVEFWFTLKSNLEGAAEIRQMTSLEYNGNWVDWPSSGDGSVRYIRWSRGTGSDFRVKMYSKYNAAEGRTPEIHFGPNTGTTTSPSYPWDNIIDYSITPERIDEQSYYVIFDCHYKNTTGMVGVHVASSSSTPFAEGEHGTQGSVTNPMYSITVVQYVKFGENVFSVPDTRSFKFHYITYLHSFDSEMYSINPNPDATVDIHFKHGQQTSSGQNQPIPDNIVPMRRLQLGDFKISIIDSTVSATAATYLSMSNFTYDGTDVSFRITRTQEEIPNTMRFKIEVDNANLLKEAELSQNPSTELIASANVIWKITFYEGGTYDGNEIEFWNIDSGEPLYLPCVSDYFKSRYGEIPLMKVYARCQEYTQRNVYLSTSHFTNYTSQPIVPESSGYGLTSYNETDGSYKYHAATFKYSIAFGTKDKFGRFITSQTQTENNEYYFRLALAEASTDYLTTMRVYVKPMVKLSIAVEPDIYIPTIGERYQYKVMHTEVLKPDSAAEESASTYGVPEEHKITNENYNSHIIFNEENQSKISVYSIGSYAQQYERIDEWYFWITVDVVQELTGGHNVQMTVDVSEQKAVSSVNISQVYVMSISCENPPLMTGERILYSMNDGGIAEFPTAFYRATSYNRYGVVNMIIHTPLGTSSINIDWKYFSFIQTGECLIEQSATTPTGIIWHLQWPKPESTLLNNNQNLFSKTDTQGIYYTNARNEKYPPIIITARTNVGNRSINFKINLEPVHELQYTSEGASYNIPVGGSGSVMFSHHERTQETTSSSDYSLPIDEDRIHTDDVYMTTSVQNVPGEIVRNGVTDINIDYGSSIVTMTFRISSSLTPTTGADPNYYIFVQKGNNYLRFNIRVIS